MITVNRDYLLEEHFYQRAQGEESPYYQHNRGDQCDPALARVLDWESFPSCGNRLLELGCGDGFITAFLAERGLVVTGIDCSPTAVSRAINNLRRNEPHPTLRVQDVCRMDAIETSAFPYILDSHCLHCVTDYDQRTAFLKECRRVLAPGGRCFLVTMARQPMDWFADLIGRPGSPRLHVDHRGHHVMTIEPPNSIHRIAHRIWISEDALREEITDAGFEILRFETFAPQNDPEDLDYLVELM